MERSTTGLGAGLDKMWSEQEAATSKIRQSPGKETSSSLLSEAIARAASKTPTKTPTRHLSKTRSLSDTVPSLSPSPRFKEPSRKASDDNAILETPAKQLGNYDPFVKGLTLQMPPRDINSGTGSGAFAAPYSPQLEPRDILGSPSSAIPRHSRGLDFSRAATHLHHSTIAEQPSPEGSPTITQKTFNHSSRRTSSHSMMLDSPRLTAGWMSAGNSYTDRPLFPRSMGSTAINSDSSSSDSDDSVMDQDNPEESIISTPQVNKFDSGGAITPFGVPRPRTLMPWAESSSPSSPAFTSMRPSRRSTARGRHSSDSTESHTRLTTPDPQLSRENTINQYLTRDSLMQTIASRRESLSLGTNHLHITSSNDDAEESGSSSYQYSGVIRRPVTRRSNLLPKTKTFARIRAALQEEGAPVDSETKREAEVVKQAFAHYNDHNWVPSTTAPPSPDLTPTIPTMPTEGSSMSDIEGLGLSNATSASSTSTSRNRASIVDTDARRGSMQKEFWSSLYNNNRMQTPPPPASSGNRARSSSGISEDMGMDSPLTSTPQYAAFTNRASTSKSDSDTMPASQTQPQLQPSALELSRKAGKRRRDDDFDVAAMKRRAVSPGLSVQSSPVMSQSPVSNSGGWWGQPKLGREPSLGAAAVGEDRAEGVRPNMTPILGPRKVGLQGMTDTSDGLMKMSID